MVKIGILSDTHGMLRQEVKDALEGCSLILHGGDIDCAEVLEELEKIAPVEAVQGNKDVEWAPGLVKEKRLEYAGLKFLMIHNKKQLATDFRDRDVIIYGHSHKYEEKREGGRLWLNPGSCGPKRFHSPVTLALLTVGQDGSYQVRRVEIPVKASERKEEERAVQELGSVDRRKLVNDVMKDMNHGRTIPSIAKRHGISIELAERICRLYVTHPGIDAEGIINKMG